ncbi:PilZ domain-containing protein [Shewanella sp. JM162201]|uniref:Cyclic diguanosine monophosphate-binding protein n=1 Tax=Shewanella jiangmenensis TaxID=2837387 RepID=A0ABS5UZ67_9GAMM|nr:PilZ domain-containing protein [Shewanella jiangmenensis]MBT1443460.1 PilZ domain-containing protein [Shewanella jiangmenensis]
MDERRKFSRILFDTPASLSDGDHRWQTRILDLSLNGALLEAPAEFNAPAEPLSLSFVLPESDVEVTLQARVAHQKANQIGLRCVHIDVESISHLRRMVELNLGDASLLNRELEHFIESHEKGD